MSKNSKMRNKALAAKQASATRKSGGSGPKQTTPKHGKQKSKWQLASQGKPAAPQRTKTEEE